MFLKRVLAIVISLALVGCGTFHMGSPHNQTHKNRTNAYLQLSEASFEKEADYDKREANYNEDKDEDRLWHLVGALTFLAVTGLGVWGIYELSKKLD